MESAWFQLVPLVLVAVLVWLPGQWQRRRATTGLRAELTAAAAHWAEVATMARADLARLRDEHQEVLHANAAHVLEGATAVSAASLRAHVVALETQIDAAVARAATVATEAASARRVDAVAARAALFGARFGDGAVVLRGTHLQADIDRAVFSAEREAEALHTVFVDTRAAVRAMFDALDDAEQAMERCVEVGFESWPIRNQTAELRAQLEQAATASARDPLEARAQMAPLERPLQALAARAQALATAAGQVVGELEPRLRDLDTRIASLRATGDRVREPGFEPDVMRARISEVAERIARHMAFGDGDAALADAREALDSADILADLVGRWARWRGVATHRVGSQVGRVQELRARRAEVEAALVNLEARASEAITVPLRNRFDRVDALLEHGLACLRVARLATDPNAQRHLAAGELLRRAQDAFDVVRDLFLEIEQKGDVLREARKQAEASFAATAEHVQAMDTLLEEPGLILSPDTESQRAHVVERYQALRRTALQPRPDWTELQTRAGRLAQLAALARDRARADEAAGEEVRTALRTSHERYAKLDVWLRAHPDQPGAAARLERAQATLADARDALQARPLAWDKVLAIVADADRCFEEAVRLSNPEVALEEVARAAVAAAIVEVEVADRPYAYGLRANVESARLALTQASAALARGAASEAEAHASEACGHALRARLDVLARVRALSESRASAALRRDVDVDARSRARAGVSERLGVAELPPVDDPAFGTTTGWSSFGRASSV